jgi:2-dehydro-3-deoxyphosphogluconate aldolase/(4S)-4-hydroxy-2-oxoglutarate aldolase
MLDLIGNIGIVPVIKIDDAKNAVPLAKALIDGGMPIAEVTFRTDAAEESIKLISEAFPKMLVGAGTVLTIEQAEKAKNAGAKFLVSPGFNPKVVKWSNDNNIPIYPGCTTPSEIEQALELGLTTLKFFPAEQSGGLDKIKALCAPYTKIKFIPTGGIDLTNVNKYLAFPKIVACGGSFMVKEDFINNQEWDKITELTKSSIITMLGFEIAHIGINANNEAEAKNITNSFSEIFNLDVKDGNSSLFAGTMLEVMKSPYLGQKGHIAIKTNSITRAIYHLQAQGVEFNEESKKFNAKGELVAIYIALEIGGFAVHLLQK